MDASQEEVEEAARAAGIHEAILNFPDKYVVVLLGGMSNVTGTIQLLGRGG